MTSTLLNVFEVYAKARSTFALACADAALRPSQAESMAECGAVALLRPLLLDAQPAVAHTASLALGRLASSSEALASAIVDADVLPHLVLSLTTESVSARSIVAPPASLNATLMTTSYAPTSSTAPPPPPL